MTGFHRPSKSDAIEEEQRPRTVESYPVGARGAGAPGEREARGGAMVGAQAIVSVRGAAVGSFSLLPSRARGTK